MLVWSFKAGEKVIIPNHCFHQKWYEVMIFKLQNYSAWPLLKWDHIVKNMVVLFVCFPSKLATQSNKAGFTFFMTHWPLNKNSIFHQTFFTSKIYLNAMPIWTPKVRNWELQMRETIMPSLNIHPWTCFHSSIKENLQYIIWVIVRNGLNWILYKSNQTTIIIFFSRSSQFLLKRQNYFCW